MRLLLAPIAARFVVCAAAGVLAGALLSACGGGGGGGATPAAPASATSAPTVAAPATAAPQVITMALPGGSAIGTETDPTYGLVGGYTESLYSQVLVFLSSAQVMILNGQPASNATPHTLNVLSQTSFPASPTLSTTASGGTTLAAGYASGSVGAGAPAIGPITLTAGTYYIGCGFHYASNTMRTVLIVAANASPGTQATPVPSDTPVPNNAYGY
jgi:hypothetical protein